MADIYTVFWFYLGNHGRQRIRAESGDAACRAVVEAFSVDFRRRGTLVAIRGVHSERSAESYFKTPQKKEREFHELYEARLGNCMKLLNVALDLVADTGGDEHPLNIRQFEITTTRINAAIAAVDQLKNTVWNDEADAMTVEIGAEPRLFVMLDDEDTYADATGARLIEVPAEYSGDDAWQYAKQNFKTSPVLTDLVRERSTDVIRLAVECAQFVDDNTDLNMNSLVMVAPGVMIGLGDAITNIMRGLVDGMEFIKRAD